MRVSLDPVTYESNFITSRNNSQDEEFDEISNTRPSKIDKKRTCKAFIESPTVSLRSAGVTLGSSTK